VTGFDAAEVARWASASWTRVPSEVLCGFSIDTRQLRPGQVFVALKTEKCDGHDYLAAAKAAGAAAALVARADTSLDLPQLVVSECGDLGGDRCESAGGTLRAFQRIAQNHRERFQAAGGKVIGITGSVGKTSTKNLLAALLGAQSGQGDRVLATEGNLNNHLGVPLTLTRIDPARHRFAVIEAGIGGPGEMEPLAKMIGPDVAIITAVAPAHLAALGDIEGVAREKAILAAHTRDGGDKRESLGVDQCAGGGGVAIFPESLRDFAAFRSLQTRRISEGTFGGLSTEFSLPKLSAGMTGNARLAIRTALYLGVAPAQIQARLDTWAPAPLRGQTFSESDGRFIYLDCYNANPASMADALDAFYAQAPEALPRVFVLGGMEELGERSVMFHRALGRSLRLRPQDRAYAIGDEAEALRTGALESGLVAPAQISVVETLAALRAALAEFHGALFLKGSRRYQLETLIAPDGSAAGKPNDEATANKLSKRKEFAAKTLWKGNPAGEDGSEISHALPPYAQSGSGDALTVVKRPTAVKAVGDCSFPNMSGATRSETLVKPESETLNSASQPFGDEAVRSVTASLRQNGGGSMPRA